MYLPKDNITLLEGYSEEEFENIKAIIDDCIDVIWYMARYYSEGGRSETAPKIGLVAHFNLCLAAHFIFGLSARFNFGLIA